MKHHNGKKRINKLDGGKKKAKRQYHKGIRKADKEECHCSPCTCSSIPYGFRPCSYCINMGSS